MQDSASPADVVIRPALRSRDLFGDAREIVIEHHRRTYRLRITAQGKLILTA